MQTLKEIAVALKIPESTLRIYRDEFEELVPAEGEGRRRRYAPEGTALLGKIVGWKREGWTSGQIRDALSREVKPQARVRRRNTDERLDELAALIRAQSGELALLRVEVGALRSEVRRLAETLRQDIPPTLEEALRG
jgi:DNA-binding transcriptional MerR regulator